MPPIRNGRSLGIFVSRRMPKATTAKIVASVIASRMRSATIVPSSLRLPASARLDISTTLMTSPARAGRTLLPMYPTQVSE